MFNIKCLLSFFMSSYFLIEERFSILMHFYFLSDWLNKKKKLSECFYIHTLDKLMQLIFFLFFCYALFPLDRSDEKCLKRSPLDKVKQFSKLSDTPRKGQEKKTNSESKKSKSRETDRRDSLILPKMETPAESKPLRSLFL